MADSQCHNYHWDRLRILAMLGIIWFHITGESLWLGFGLPFFLILSLTLAVMRPSLPPIREFVIKRVRRLIVPWLFWCLVLGSFLVLRALIHPARTDQPEFEWTMLLYGPEDHLWFLPFAAVAGVVVYSLRRLTDRAPLWSLVALTVPAALGLIVWSSRANLEIPFHQWAFSAAAVPLSLGLGRIMAARGTTYSLKGMITAFMAVFVLGWLFIAFFEPPAQIQARRFAVSLVLVGGVVWLPDRPDRVTSSWVPLLLGVYVLHMTVYHQVVQRLERTLSWTMDGWSAALLALLISTALVAVLRRTLLRTFL